MTALFTAAIKAAGATAINKHGGGFAASVQPFDVSGDGHGSTGRGHAARFRLYAELCKASESLETDGELICGGRRYVVESIETYTYRGAGVFRKGLIRLTEEA